MSQIWRRPCAAVLTAAAVITGGPAACSDSTVFEEEQMVRVHGTVAPGFERVRVAFEENFLQRGDLGAACCVYVDGERVVDLWAGHRDVRTADPWERDTMACVFSTTKGMAAAAMVVAHSQGLFELDQPIARYWPEFAQNGKETVTVRQLLSHQAGLSVIDEKITPEAITDTESWSRVLARQRLQWAPGERHGYHGLSLGFYESELIRRTDPRARSLGKFFAEEVAAPLGASFYIALPDEIPEHRIATMEPFRLLDLFLRPDLVSPRLLLSMVVPWSLAHRSLMNVDMGGPGDIAERQWTRTEFPSATGVGSARGLARIMSALATDDPDLPLADRTRDELWAPAPPPLGGTRDLILGVPLAYSFGFTRACETFDHGFGASGFGAHGAGGSVAFGDPGRGVGFAYVMNRMSVHMGDDPRPRALADAVYACLEDREAR